MAKGSRLHRLAENSNFSKSPLIKKMISYYENNSMGKVCNLEMMKFLNYNLKTILGNSIKKYSFVQHQIEHQDPVELLL